MMDLKKLNYIEDEGTYDKITETINDIYKSFEYTNISKEEYEQIVITVIKETSNNEYDNSISYNDFIANNIKEKLVEYIKTNIINRKNCVDILNNYINNNFSSIKNYKQALKYFDNLNNIFKLYNISPNIDRIITLIKNNENLSKMFELIKNYYYKEIIKEN